MEKTMKNPKLIPVPFADSGIKDDIPKVKSTSMSDEKASWEAGFPETTMLPVYAGGLPPDGKDFNGVLNQISENIVFQSKGGRYKFDPDFALSIGGYPKGATLQNNDESAEYQSLIDNNLVNFNTATPEEIAQAWRITGLGDATEVLNGKLDKAAVKNERGLSQTEVVSQKVVTELGSGIVGSFEDGLNFIKELTNEDQQVTIENEFGRQAYCWSGEFPKEVPAGFSPETLGGIGSNAWVEVGGASLHYLLSKEGTKVVKDEKGRDLNQIFSDMNYDSKQGKFRTLSHVKVFAELPLQPVGYQDIINQYGYQYLYPQGMCFFEDEIYINCSGVGGGNTWAWIYVYDKKSLELKSIFSAGDTSSEGVHVTRINGVKHLFILEAFSMYRNGKTGVYELPDSVSSINMNRLTPIIVCNTGQYFQIGGFGNMLILEINSGSPLSNSIQRRTKFNYYNVNDLINNENPIPIGAISVNANLERVGKRQGVTITPNGLIMGYGAYSQYGSEITQDKMYAFRMVSFSGNEIDSFIGDPNVICDIITPYLHKRPTRMENEGVSYVNEHGVCSVFSLNITDSATNPLSPDHGILILEQNVSPYDAKSIDISMSLNVLGLIDESNDTSIQLAEYPFDRLENKRLETLDQILDMMNRDGMQEYRFYNGSSPYIKDINGDPITPSCSVTIENMNLFTYFLSVIGNRTRYFMMITGNKGGPYTQRISTVIESPETNVRPEFIRNKSRVIGVDSNVSENVYTDSESTTTVERYYSGRNTSPSLSGSIIVNGANKTTSFNTTSDERLKDDEGEYSDGLNKIKGIKENSAIRKFKFKGSDIEQYGFFAQRLEKVIPSAVSYDESTDTYLVSLASLVPDLVSAIIELSSELEAIKLAMATSNT